MKALALALLASAASPAAAAVPACDETGSVAGWSVRAQVVGHGTPRWQVSRRADGISLVLAGMSGAAWADARLEGAGDAEEAVADIADRRFRTERVGAGVFAIPGDAFAPAVAEGGRLAVTLRRGGAVSGRASLALDGAAQAMTAASDRAAQLIDEADYGRCRPVP